MERSARFSKIVTEIWAQGGPPQPGYNHYQTEWAQQGGYMRPWLFQNDELEELVCGGYSEVEIAKQLQRTKDGVRHQLRNLGYPSSYATNTKLFIALNRSGIAPRRCFELVGSSVGESRITPTLDETKLIRLYDEIGATNGTIADHIGVRIGTIIRWRRQYEIARPIRRKLSVVAKDARSRILPDGLGGVA